MARNFLDSSNRWTYIKIAIKNGTTPWRVYRLAHGSDECHEKDQKIMHDLKEAKIIRHHHSHHHHHHSDNEDK